jgi:hypothetical protein
VPFSFPFIHAQSFDSLSLASSYLPRSALALNCCIRETENPPSPAANSNQLPIGYGRPLCAKPFRSAYLRAVATTKTCSYMSSFAPFFLLAVICLSAYACFHRHLSFSEGSIWNLSYPLCIHLHQTDRDASHRPCSKRAKSC